MKASLKFREDQKPLLRAKVPLSIVGFPFQSGIVAGESKELSLNLTTFFDSGPSFKISYRPSDSLNPFSLIFKTGIGYFGSPISSPITMSAEFNLISNQNPRFFVHFKPQFGDFTIKKSQSSDFVKSVKSKSKSGVLSDDDASIEVIESPVVVKSGYFTENGLFSDKKTAVLPSGSPAASVVYGLLNGMEMSARTIMPLRQRAVVKFRWGVRFPAAEEESAAEVVGRANPTAGISIQKFPLLVMNKIAIEHVAEDKNKMGPSLKSPENTDVAEACLTVKRQLEVIQAENGMLKQAMDDLRSEIVAGKLSFLPAGGVDIGGKYREAERRGVKPSGGKVDRRSNNGDKKSSSSSSSSMTMEEDVNEELKKALMGATGASI